MAENSRTSKLSSKDDECVFSWKLFTGWDFMIGKSVENVYNFILTFEFIRSMRVQIMLIR